MYRLLLAGDGGSVRRGDPLLALLGTWGDAHPERTTAVFLGDNIYPQACRTATEAGARRSCAARSPRPAPRSSSSPATTTGASRACSVSGPVFCATTGLPRVAGGSPGRFQPEGRLPRTRAAGAPRAGRPLPGGLTLLVLDLHWWLLAEHERPVCDGVADTAAFLERFRAELAARRSENVVVVAHHPIRSGGPHGGFTRGFWFDIGSRSSTGSTPSRI